jgi:two-component system OmpR family response regulator
VSGIRDLLGLSKRAAVGLHIDGLELTRIEEHLLSRLIFAAGTPVAREDLVEEAWGWRATAHGPLHQSISRLRRKLEELGWSIRNVRGVGYQLEQPARTRGRE